MTACSATTRRGAPCGFAPRRGTNRCINHEDGAPTREASAKAASASVAARRYPSEWLGETALSLRDRASIQAVLDALVRLQLSGRISIARSAIILRACSIATRNFDRLPSTLYATERQDHDPTTYWSMLQGLLGDVDDLLEEAAEHDNPPPQPPPQPATP